MTTNQLKPYNFTYKEVKYSFPPLSEVPFDALDKLTQLQNINSDSTQDSGLAMLDCIRELRDSIPEFAKFTKIASLGEISNRLKLWLSLTVKQGKADASK